MANTAPQQQQQQPKTSEFRFQDVITVTARLAQLLAEEVDLLNEMKVSKIETLQHEKIFLTNALDAQRKFIEQNPYIKEQISAQEKRDMAKISEVFQNVLAENHKKLLLAKEVNFQVVRAIRDVVKENTQSRTYNGSGYTGAAAFSTLSVTLNKMI